MKKWIWIVAIAILVFFGIGVNIYINALEPKNEAKVLATEIALEQTDIETVESFSLFNGSSSYYVVKGKNTEGEALIAWIPEQKDNRKIIVKEEKEGINKDEAIQKLYDKKKPEEIISVKLGMEKNIPLWEIYYRSNDNLINYYYIDFETGEWLKDIQNL